LARQKLSEYAERKKDDLFPNNPADVQLGNQSTYELLQEVEELVLAIKPDNARDQWWLAQATTLASKIGDERGFGGIVHVSPVPMNHVVAVLQAELRNETAGSHT